MSFAHSPDDASASSTCFVLHFFRSLSSSYFSHGAVSEFFTFPRMRYSTPLLFCAAHCCFSVVFLRYSAFLVCAGVLCCSSLLFLCHVPLSCSFAFSASFPVLLLLSSSVLLIGSVLLPLLHGGPPLSFPSPVVATAIHTWEGQSGRLAAQKSLHKKMSEDWTQQYKHIPFWWVLNC